MSDPGRHDFRALGTGCVVLVTDPATLTAAVNEVQAELADVDLACSRFRPDSELELVNNNAGEATEVSPLLVDAVLVALRAAELTDGDVDPTVGEAMQVLGYDRDFGTLPKDGEAVVTVVRVPGWQKIEVNLQRRTVRIPKGVRLDLGATAKALAADRAATRAAAVAGCGVLVSLGGDLAVAG
ncbi:MAG: FAD:protein FMN transferase, partial [Acidimicrobiia bacterium]|nr:FAD:protein FMN transferase [Acidimicrobiia bacterium]